MEINNINELQKVVENFMMQDIEEINVCISSKLRKPIREFKNYYPSIFYFAYGLGKTYDFHIYKNKPKINFLILSKKCKKFFINNIGLKININIDQETIDLLNPYFKLNEHFDLLSDALIYVGGEKEFISKHFDLDKKIWNDIKKSAKYNDWKNKYIVEKKLNYQPNLSFLQISTPNDYKKFGFYLPENDNKCFLSIDLKAANFQILKMEGLIGTNTWEEYMNKFINHDILPCYFFLYLFCM